MINSESSSPTSLLIATGTPLFSSLSLDIPDILRHTTIPTMSRPPRAPPPDTSPQPPPPSQQQQQQQEQQLFNSTTLLANWPTRLKSENLLPSTSNTTGNRTADHNNDKNDDNDDDDIFNFETSIQVAFGLGHTPSHPSHHSKGDDYVYRAMTAGVRLAEVQRVIAGVERGKKNQSQGQNLRGKDGLASSLYGWWYDVDGSGDVKTSVPSPQDIEAYTSVFASTTSTSKALIGLEKNAKKGSIRAGVAAHLNSLRYLPSDFDVPKLKTAHVNPYLDYWRWSCQHLDWTGPDAHTAKVRHSHHILPVFYHHFGCVCPSFESLQVIKQVAKQRPVLEIGSGNGYWAIMLRRLGMEVRAIDNVESEWRTMWISDTIVTDGVSYLRKNHAGEDTVLLMVYPVARPGFTSSILQSYRGDVVCVVGTQNRNGYTGFADTTLEEYMTEKMSAFQKTVQIPLPSFAGKDDALFVFLRKTS